MSHISYEFEENLVAFCGQYCRECIYYKNLFGIRAKDLLNEIERDEWIKIVWESLNAPFDVDNFIAGLSWLASSPGCPGCRAGAGWSDCPIRICAQNKGIRGCFDCSDYPCPTMSKDEASHQRQFVEQIKKAGLTNYIRIQRGE